MAVCSTVTPLVVMDMYGTSVLYKGSSQTSELRTSNKLYCYIRYVWLCAVCKSMQVLAEFEKLIFDKLCGSGVGGGRGDLDARLGNDGSRLHTICTEI